MSTSHRIRVLGRELLVRSEAPSERVKEIESCVNGKVAEVSSSVRGGDPQVVAILALMNIAEAYLDLQAKHDACRQQGDRVGTLLRRIDDIVAE